jgi:iron complex transport system ATP-binding protein
VAYAYPGGPPVLDGVDLELRAGEVTALLGPNGTGKTTLLRLALGLLAADAGQVLLGERAIATLGRREIARRIGLVPQRERVIFPFSVLDYVLLGRAAFLRPFDQPGPADLDAARDALEWLGAGALADREVTTLSGGEQQLAMIARTLAQDPAALLLDEPGAHLDLANRARVHLTLRRLAAAGRAVLYTTHDPGSAALAADRVVMLGGGRIVADGPPLDVLSAPLLSRVYGVDVRVEMIDGRPLVIEGTPRPARLLS